MKPAAVAMFTLNSSAVAVVYSLRLLPASVLMWFSQSSTKPLLVALASPVALLQGRSDHGIDGKFRPSEKQLGFPFRE